MTTTASPPTTALIRVGTAADVDPATDLAARVLGAGARPRALGLVATIWAGAAYREALRDAIAVRLWGGLGEWAVASLGGRTVGLAFAERDWVLLHMVDPAVRGRGIGTEL